MLNQQSDTPLNALGSRGVAHNVTERVDTRASSKTRPVGQLIVVGRLPRFSRVLNTGRVVRTAMNVTSVVHSKVKLKNAPYPPAFLVSK